MKKSKSNVRNGPPALSVLQAQMQQAILGKDDRIFAVICDNSRTSRTTLFAVYRDGYKARLVEVLENDYPLTARCAGKSVFRKLAHAYIAAHPSRTSNARWFGADLPAFVGAHEPTAPFPEFCELAHIEKFIGNAFDSADAKVLSVSDLVAYAAEDWSRLTFGPHPSVTAFAARTNAFSIWRALKSDMPPLPAEVLPAPQTIVVWRHQGTPKVRIMTYEESMMWTEACRGVPFGVLCEMLATFEDADGAAGRAAGYLQSWLESEMLTSATLGGGPRAHAPAAGAARDTCELHNSD